MPEECGERTDDAADESNARGKSEVVATWARLATDVAFAAGLGLALGFVGDGIARSWLEGSSTCVEQGPLGCWLIALGAGAACAVLGFACTLVWRLRSP